MTKKQTDGGIRSVLKSIDLKSYTLILLLVVTTVFLTVITDGLFISSRNISMLFRQMAITGIIGCAMFLHIVHGKIDLSVGSTMFLCSTFVGVLQVKLGWTSFTAIMGLGILIGVVIGAWNGIWVSYLKLPPFIVTLGSQLISKGIALALAKGALLGPFIDSVKVLGQAYIPANISLILGVIASASIIAIILCDRLMKKQYGLPVPSFAITVTKIVVYCSLVMGVVLLLNSYDGIAVPIMIMIVLGIIFSFITKKCRYGRNLYAIGSNEEAARFSGINVEKNSFIAYLLSGGLSALAGIVLAARLNMATTTIGNMSEMDAIMACVIGGASMDGGSGSIIGVLGGALLVACIENGMSLMNLDSFWQYLVKGLVLTLVVWYDISSRNKQ